MRIKPTESFTVNQMRGEIGLAGADENVPRSGNFDFTHSSQRWSPALLTCKEIRESDEKITSKLPLSRRHPSFSLIVWTPVRGNNS